MKSWPVALVSESVSTFASAAGFAARNAKLKPISPVHSKLMDVKSSEKKFEPGIIDSAFGKATKARPGPNPEHAITSAKHTRCSVAMKPRTEKTGNDAGSSTRVMEKKAVATQPKGKSYYLGYADDWVEQKWSRRNSTLSAPVWSYDEAVENRETSLAKVSPQNLYATARIESEEDKLKWIDVVR